MSTGLPPTAPGATSGSVTTETATGVSQGNCNTQVNLKDVQLNLLGPERQSEFPPLIEGSTQYIYAEQIIRMEIRIFDPDLAKTYVELMTARRLGRDEE